MNLNKNRKNENRKSRSVQINKTVTLLVLFCLCIGAISMVAAKYIKQNTTKNNAAAAREFYFESDFLDSKTHEIEIMPTDNGTANVTIRLKNYIDDLRYSETEIEYTVNVTEENATDTETGATIDPKTGTIETGNPHHKDITIANLQAGKTYKITATTDNIYKKTLTGTIKVSEPDTKVYASVHDETQYIEVTIWTKDYAGNVSLNYSATNLIPDNTDTKMKDATTGTGRITETDWKANTSHVYRFFKNDENQGYQVTVNDEEVTVSETTE